MKRIKRKLPQEDTRRRLVHHKATTNATLLRLLYLVYIPPHFPKLPNLSLSLFTDQSGPKVSLKTSFPKGFIYRRSLRIMLWHTMPWPLCITSSWFCHLGDTLVPWDLCLIITPNCLFVRFGYFNDPIIKFQKLCLWPKVSLICILIIVS